MSPADVVFGLPHSTLQSDPNFVKRGLFPPRPVRGRGASMRVYRLSVDTACRISFDRICASPLFGGQAEAGSRNLMTSASNKNSRN